MSRISDPDAGSYVCEPCDFLVTPTLTVNNKKCAKFTGARTRDRLAPCAADLDTQARNELPGIEARPFPARPWGSKHHDEGADGPSS